jgi:hypothetical protein
MKFTWPSKNIDGSDYRQLDKPSEFLRMARPIEKGTFKWTLALTEQPAHLGFESKQASTPL